MKDITTTDMPFVLSEVSGKAMLELLSASSIRSHNATTKEV